MQIYRDLNQFNQSEKPKVIAIGNFDGVHLGHQKLINVAKEIANTLHGETCVLTFYPQPQALFVKNFKMINSFAIKAELIRNLGVDHLIAIPFTEEFSVQSPEEFIQKILHDKLNIDHVVAGFNYTFGYKGKGKADDLILLNENNGIKTTIIEPFYVNNELVSSTRIRTYLKQGQICEATQLLGYYPKLKGSIIEGKKIGRQLGFPTANLDWNKGLLLPKSGVYAVKISINGELKQGVLNIGLKPTVTNEKKLSVEVHILDYSEDIYDTEIEVVFYKMLRNEKKFDNLIDLKKQIQNDINNAKELFNDSL